MGCESAYFCAGSRVMVAESVSQDTIKYINLTLRIDACAEYTGKASGRLYIWHKAGDTQPVEEADAPDLLRRRLGKKFCCGNGIDNNTIFEVA